MGPSPRDKAHLARKPRLLARKPSPQKAGFWFMRELRDLGGTEGELNFPQAPLSYGI